VLPRLLYAGYKGKRKNGEKRIAKEVVISEEAGWEGKTRDGRAGKLPSQVIESIKVNRGCVVPGSVQAERNINWMDGV